MTSDRPPDEPVTLYSRVTRMAVAGSQQEARRLAHTYIGTEHFLLALLNPDGLAARATGQPLAIESLGWAEISYETVRSAIEARDAATSEQIPRDRDAPTKYVDREGFVLVEPLSYQEPLSQELTDALHAAAHKRTPVMPDDVLREILDRPETAATRILVSLRTGGGSCGG